LLKWGRWFQIIYSELRWRRRRGRRGEGGGRGIFIPRSSPSESLHSNQALKSG
jgi:hypothetical protein